MINHYQGPPYPPIPLNELTTIINVIPPTRTKLEITNEIIIFCFTVGIWLLIFYLIFLIFSMAVILNKKPNKNKIAATT